MPAFVIFVRERLRDPDLFQTYAVEARSSVAGHDVRLLAMNGESVAVEGADTGGVVIMQFKDMAAAMAWYTSSAYSTARTKRHLSADYRVIITQGI
jgi:uncharacterized protein (DUF1330 family)